jgi:hypothetical protein
MAYKEDFDEDDSRDEFEMIIMLAMMKSAAVRIGEAVGSIAALWRPIGLPQPSHSPQSRYYHKRLTKMFSNHSKPSIAYDGS